MNVSMHIYFDVLTFLLYPTTFVRLRIILMINFIEDNFMRLSTG